MAGHEEDFFIVSSVDAARRRLVLKRPTEVTVVMGVTERTVYLDQQGKPLNLASIRAGDTCYIRAAPDAAGELTASRVRLGAMTVEELERRYLKPSSPPQHSR